MHLAPAMRRLVVVFVTVGSIALGGGWAVSPAEATSYRFWSYWSGGSDWTFASQGAARRPADGAVEGWRFAISAASSSSAPPRHTPSFAKICGNTAPVAGKKRVGLVVDPGTSEDAPSGESPPAIVVGCVVVAEDANGYEVLTAAGAQLRTDSGLVCGVNGYPATECGVPVADPEPSDDGGSGNGSDGGSDGQPSSSGTTGSTSASGDGNRTAENDGDPDDPRSNDRNGVRPAASGSGKDDTTEDRSTTPSDAPSEVAAAAPATAPTATTNDTGSPLGVLIGLTAVVILGIAAWVLRGNRS